MTPKGLSGLVYMQPFPSWLPILASHLGFPSCKHSKFAPWSKTKNIYIHIYKYIERERESLKRLASNLQPSKSKKVSFRTFQVQRIFLPPQASSKALEQRKVRVFWGEAEGGINMLVSLFDIFIGQIKLLCLISMVDMWCQFVFLLISNCC